MNKILEEHFVKTYPKIFRDMYGNPRTTCMAFGISCNDGWFFFLDTLCGKIQRYIDRRLELIAKGYALEDEKEPIPQVVASQIKEKFGGLRFYFEGGDKTISNWVDFAESLSYDICENCGKHNEQVGCNEKGWIQTLCCDCGVKNKKNIVPNENLVSLWWKVREDELKQKE